MGSTLVRSFLSRYLGPLDLAGVVGLVVPSGHHAAAVLGEADREDPGAADR